MAKSTEKNSKDFLYDDSATQRFNKAVIICYKNTFRGESGFSTSSFMSNE